MSFRFYPTNPVLQRLRDSGNIKSTSQTISAPSSPVVMSGYGELSEPNSPTALHTCKPRLKRRRCSAPPNLSIPDTIHPNTQMSKSIHIQNPSYKETPRSFPPQNGPEASTVQTSSPILTGHPVFLHEQLPDVDATNAVILRARWEKLVHATARKIRLLPKNPA